MNLIKQIEKEYLREPAKTAFSSGDTVTVNYRIQEGGKTRIQKYTGVVIQKRNGSGMNGTFTVRKASANGIFVERIFTLNSPLIEEITLETRGRVRRARIYYLRQRTGKAARIRELKTLKTTVAAATVAVAVAEEVAAVAVEEPTIAVAQPVATVKPVTAAAVESETAATE